MNLYLNPYSSRLAFVEPVCSLSPYSIQYVTDVSKRLRITKMTSKTDKLSISTKRRTTRSEYHQKMPDPEMNEEFDATGDVSSKCILEVPIQPEVTKTEEDDNKIDAINDPNWTVLSSTFITELPTIARTETVTTTIADDTDTTSILPTQSKPSSSDRVTPPPGKLNDTLRVDDSPLLEWSADNHLPDVFALAAGDFENHQVWIPIFTGNNFLIFLEKFKELRAVLNWDETTSRAYFLRSMKEPVLALRDHIRSWRFETMEMYLTEYYADRQERLQKIEKTFTIRRRDQEELRGLAMRISIATAKLYLSTDKRDQLSTVVFREALAEDIRLQRHLHRERIRRTRFEDQVEAAVTYETTFGANIAYIPADTPDSTINTPTKHQLETTGNSPIDNVHIIRVMPITTTKKKDQ